MKKVVYLAICFAIFSACSDRQNKEPLPEETATKVVTRVVNSVKKNVELKYSGTIEPSQKIPLTFQVTGIVEKVLVDAGDEVTKGQLLATVNDEEMRSIYNTSLAQYNQAKDAYDRLKTVHDQGSLPEIKWVEMETKLAQAKSSLEIATANLAKNKLCAPSSGVIGKRNIEPGMAAFGTTSAPLELIEIKTVYVKISVPENEIASISKGMKAKFRVSALNDKEFDGAVSNLSPVADLISRTYEVKILVQNTDLQLKPGMVCDVDMNISTEKEMVLVPYQSVGKDNEGNKYVFLVSADNKRVKKQIVQTGNFYENSTEIISGLKNGDQIVCQGKEKLTDNSLINL
jgi:RND family efflux transporter MFP subunit